jgi:hypothetical protein
MYSQRLITGALTPVFAVVARHGAMGLSVPACRARNAGTGVGDTCMIPASLTSGAVLVRCVIVWCIGSSCAIVAHDRSSIGLMLSIVTISAMAPVPQTELAQPSVQVLTISIYVVCTKP